jgi:hypothetical protein
MLLPLAKKTQNILGGIKVGLFAGGVNFQEVGTSMASAARLWMNATIQIVDPNTADAVWSEWTNTETGGAPTVLWQGPARIQHLKYESSPVAGYSEAGIRGIRLQIPLDPSAGFIRKGLQVIVMDGGNDYELEQLQFTITSAINSSYAWVRTIEAEVDVKSIANSTWSGIAGTVVNSSAVSVSSATVRTFHLEDGLWISDYETTTDVRGNYQLPADASVPVAVGVIASGYVTQFYNNKPSQATADTVTPVNHVETQSIDFVIQAV